WRTRRQRNRGERMIRQTVGELGKDVRGRRCDQKKIRAVGQFDVAGPPVFFFVEETRHRRIFGKGLQGERRDELGRVVRHHWKNLVTLFHEQTRELGRFVGGD